MADRHAPTSDSQPPRRRSRSRSRSPPRRPRNDDDREDRRDRDRERIPKSSSGFKWKEKRRGDNEHRDTRGGSHRGYRNRSRSPRRDRDVTLGSAPTAKDASKKDKRDKKDKKPKPPRSGGEELIIVQVNDRLGTKAQIPCLPSDLVKQFKVLVAAKIGREPHEILLKRQGERPFNDHFTLGDYGVSHGVQLDLEVDTRD